MVLLTFTLTDFIDSINCKIFLRYRNNRYKNEGDSQAPTSDEVKKLEDIVSRVKVNSGIKVRGTCQHDNFSNSLVLMVQDIASHELVQRMDEAEEKRIELHAHTQMSMMDATVSASDLIQRAEKWGHEAIAITDHGVVQAYPEAFAAAKKHNIKLIPGLEAYMMDSIPIVRRELDQPIDDMIVVLDFETTGLNPKTDRIIEIGAVKLKEGKVVDSYSQMVNPGIPLPSKITEITGISDHMLIEAPDAAETLPKLLQFIGDAPLAAHNANFDRAFLENELLRIGESKSFNTIDTLYFAQKLYPELKSFRLKSVCKFLGVSLKNAHRAVFDATATAQILAIMLDEAKQKGARSLLDIDKLIQGYTKSQDRHVILLAKSQNGLQNINRLVTMSHLDYFHYTPKIPRDKIEEFREGILIGSACANGELFQAIAEGLSKSHIEKIAGFYDYLEVQPVDNHLIMIRRGVVSSREALIDINKKIIQLGDKLGIPVVATGDSHYLEPEDSVFRAILHHSQRNEYADELPKQHFRTTQEMLEAFSYLSAQKAKEIVIDNPKKILAQIETISLYPKHPNNLTTFSPVWESADEEIRRMSMDNAHKLYGDILPDLIQKRLKKELSSITGYGYATLYSIANKLVTKSMSDGYLVGSRGSVGSSLVATMCNITEVNPLPPHYRCAACRKAFFDIPQEVTVGIDLPDKVCDVCGTALIKDGYDIPFEVFLGFKGDKVPDIDLNFSGEYQAKAHAYVEELFGKGYVFRAGTIGTLQEKTAYGLVLKYIEERGKQFSDAEKSRLALGCMGVKRTTGQHPGGIVVLPKDYDITQFTAVQHPSDDSRKGVVTTHYDFASMHDILVKLDILGHDDPTMIHMMERLSSVAYNEVPLDDKKVMSLFTSPEALGVSASEIGSETGTLGIPEFGTAFVRQMLMDTKPSTMEELIRISGLSHGTDVWIGNTKDLIASKTATLKSSICTRDDIMNTLIARGVTDKIAFDAMESVRKGKGLTPQMEAAMRENGIEQWYIDSCNKIAYMFPKGHAVAYVTMALRVAWYKIYWPLQYYAAYFTIRSRGFDARTMTRPKSHIVHMLDELNALDTKAITATQKDEIVALEMVREMLCRGFSFLAPDLYKSDAGEFLIEGTSLRVPLGSVGGLGQEVAQNVILTRNERFLSIDDLKKRTKITSSTVELLREAGALNNLSETNQ
ncbi:MAG: PolC-type DNA polymerase III, partial [Clostridiales bacterium]|nr:PolC-type DNA polymerase III [Clostridiales bacterium]